METPTISHKYRGMFIDQRRRWSKKTESCRTFGYYVGSKYFSCMSDAQQYIDDQLHAEEERKLGDEELTGYFD